MKSYKYVIVGGGISGYTLALELSSAGEEVCLIEKKYLGGTCLNEGCILSKMLLHHSKFEQRVPYLFQHCFERISYLRRSIEQMISQQKIHYFNDEAVIKEEKKIFLKKQSQELTFKKLIIATGAKTSIPSSFNNAEKCIYTENFLEVFMGLKNLPEDIVIVGGGYIGVEFAVIFSQLGIKVTLIEKEEKILPSVSDDITKIVEHSLEKQGIRIIKNAVIGGVEEQVVSLTDGREFLYDYLFLATGRTANMPESSLMFERNFEGQIFVDKHFESSQKDIFLIGDVLGSLQFAHKAEYDARLLAGYFLRGEIVFPDYNHIPKIIFSSPKIATVGKNNFPGCRTVKVDFVHLGKAHCDESTQGFLKLFIDEKGVVKGGEIVNENAQEILVTLQLIVYNKMDCKEVANFVFPHPSSSEIIKEAVKTYLKDWD